MEKITAGYLINLGQFIIMGVLGGSKTSIVPCEAALRSVLVSKWTTGKVAGSLASRSISIEKLSSSYS